MPLSDQSNARTLLEVQLSHISGQMLADGKFVVETKDGIAYLNEVLRSLGNPMESYRITIRLSELLNRSERDELEELRELVRTMRRAES